MFSKQYPAVAVLAFLAVLNLAGCKGKGSALVTVGNRSITESDLDVLAKVNPRLKPRLESQAGKQKVLENYVEQELLYQESKRRGLDRDNIVKDKLGLYKKIIIAQALLDDELDKKVKEYYQNHQDEFERLKLSHILIRTAPVAEATKNPKDKKAKQPATAKRSDAEALKLAEKAKERVAKGEDFGAVAKGLSEDDRTKGNQGDLGYVTIHDKRLERWNWLGLAEKAFAMKTGDTSDPIKTKDGYHIIKVTEEKKLQPQGEAEAAIKFRLQSDVRTQLLEDLKKKYKVHYAKSEDLTPQAPAAVSSPTTQPAQPEAQAAPEPTPPSEPQ